MNTSNILLSELDNHGILRLTLNDPARRNALSEAMLTQLGDALKKAGSDDAVRVIILAANGTVFCAGHDLKEMSAGRSKLDGGEAYFAKIMSICSGVMLGIVNCPKPVIAEVAGVATAAGCQLVASCDLAIATYTSKFSTPGVHIGLFCSTPMVALSRNIRNKHSMEMLLTGDMISAERAADMGLINKAVSIDALQDTTNEMARKIASKSSMTLATGKKAFYQQSEMPLQEAYEYASKVMVENMLAHDAQEGIEAFIEKRMPKWRDG